MKNLIIFIFIIYYPNILLAQNLIPFRVNDQWGYVSKAGHWIVAPIFDGAAEIHHGLGSVHK